jgi:hypothetical protein
MGQYYLAIILGEEGQKPEIIRIYMTPFNSGMKLTEHSYLKNNFVNTFESLLAPDGIFYKSRIVWAGDYADNEVGQEENLHQIAFNQPNKDFTTKYQALTLEKNQYIINHTKKQYVDKEKHDKYHPLPLLVAEGNGRGGGDYHGINQDIIGSWSRDVISVENKIPDDYVEFVCKFDGND